MPFYSIQNSLLIVKVNSFGAELCSVKSIESNIEYIWQANPAIWARHAPNLFPIVGKLKNNSYHYHKTTYELPQHGFVRDSEFICVEESETKLVFELTASDETLVNYPFHFSLQITYSLVDSTLLTEYTVFNPDNKTLYFSVGAHPAFNCPLLADEIFEDYELQFPNLTQLIINKLNEGLISNSTRVIALNNNHLKASQSLFDNDALVLANNQIKQISLVSEKSSRGITMDCENWPYFGIWTKKQTEHYICLEPWFGIADFENTPSDLETKTGIINLPAYETFHCSFNLTFF